MAFGKKRIPKHLVVDDYYHYIPRAKRRQKWPWVIASILVLGSSMLFALHSRASEIENAGNLQFKNANGSQVALHLDTEVEAEINGLVAHINYKQRFKNQSSDWQEGLYSFPLPETAGINYMEMKVGDRVIVGEIKEKHEAKRIYKQALKQGKRAALTEQQRPNLFTQKIANIAPGEEIQISLKYQQKIEYRDSHFEWRLPTTFTPRYIPGSPLPTEEQSDTEAGVNRAESDQSPQQENIASQTNTLTSMQTNKFGWAQATDQVPDAHLVTPRMKYAHQHGSNPISIKIKLNSGLSLSNISSLYHDVNISKKNKQHNITLRNGQTEMDRDFVLQWSPVASKMPSAAVFSEKIDGEFYSLLMLIPPTESSNSKLARDIIFIIDTSGSMQGPSIQQAKQGLNLALQELSYKDRFNIVEFNSNYSLLFSDVSPATPENIQHALTWVNRLNADGGTEMYSALDAAFTQMPDDERLQQIVFITDGAVGNEKALFKLIHDQLDTSRLFTVGIGSAPNSYFMRKAAEFGRGTFSHIGNSDDISQTMSALFNKLNSAVSTNVKVDWLNNVEQYPERIGELYRNEALTVVAKSGKKPKKVNIIGELNQRQWHQSIANSGKSNHRGVASIWARQKIEHIEDEKIAGTISEDQAKNKILSVALAHKLISRFTSFIAVEKRASRPSTKPLKSNTIANQVANGQTVSPVMLPQTATTAEIAWWFGLFGFVACLIAYRMKGEQE